MGVRRREANGSIERRVIRTERCNERGTTRVRRAVRIPLTCRSVCLLGVMSFPSHSFRHASDVRSEGVAKGWKGDDMTGWVVDRGQRSEGAEME